MNTELREKTDELVSQIREAFATVKLGKGITLRDASEEYCNPESSYKRRQASGGWARPWQEEDIQAEDSGGSAMSFMDQEAFRYYLPAYMIEYLGRYLPDPKSVLCPNPYDFTIVHLCPDFWIGCETRLTASNEYKFALLNNEQSCTVARFLLLVLDTRAQHPKHAYFDENEWWGLFRYWSQYLPADEQQSFNERYPLLHGEQ